MSWPGRGCLSKGENGANTILVLKAGSNVFPEVSGMSGSGQRNSVSACLVPRLLGTCSAAVGHTVAWRAETLLWPPGASAPNHTSFCLIYICFEKHGDPEIEGRKARLGASSWAPLARIRTSRCSAPRPAPGHPALCFHVGLCALGCGPAISDTMRFVSYSSGSREIVVCGSASDVFWL